MFRINGSFPGIRRARECSKHTKLGASLGWADRAYNRFRSRGYGFSWGEGKLTQAGKEYPLKVSGLAVGSVGITKASAYGKVYKLTNVKDISGTYTALGAGVTLGGGGSAVTMQNAKGVIVDLISTSEGVKFSLGSAGVTIELKE